MSVDAQGKPVFDVTTVEVGDVVYYYNFDQGKFLIDQGQVKDENFYTDGVQVHGEGWKQYVSKFQICKVVRNGEVIFKQEDMPEEETA